MSKILEKVSNQSQSELNSNSAANPSSAEEEQYNLGCRYLIGDGVSKDEKKAFELIKLAADQGLAKAQNKLGVCYKEGIGTNKDEKKAFELVQLAANQGYVAAQNNLGECYENGIGTNIDQKKAFEFYKLAAKQGGDIARNNLGDCYSFGKGTDKDEKKAFEFYQLAAKQGLAIAQMNLGDCYFFGIGTNKNEKKTFEFYQLAAEQGLPSAQYYLGNCYEKGIGTSKDEKKAFELYQLAAKEGFSKALNNLGNCYEKGIGTSKDEKKAFEHYKIASNQGLADALYKQGYCYKMGIGINKDEKKAFQFIQKAALAGLKEAELELVNLKNNNKLFSSIKKIELEILEAAKNGDIKKLSEIVTTENVNTPNSEGLQPIFYAAANNHVEVLDLLLKRGANINAQLEISEKNSKFTNERFSENCALISHHEDFTPLMTAARSNSLDAFIFLFNKGADCKIKTKYETDVLKIVCEWSNLSIIEYLINNILNGKIFDINNDIKRAFFSIPANRNFQVISYFVEILKCDIFQIDSEGRNILHYLISDSNDVGVKYILEKCVKSESEIKKLIDARDVNGRTPLLFGAGANSASAIEYYIEKFGVDLNDKDSEGSNILHLLCGSGTYGGIKVLFEHIKKEQGVKLLIESRNILGETPFFIVFDQEDASDAVIEFIIIDLEIKIDQINDHGQSALHLLCSHKQNEESIKFLLEKCTTNEEKNKLLNTKDKDNNTPFLTAVKKGYLEYVKYFVEEINVDNNQINCKGGALDISVEEKHENVTKYLLNKCPKLLDRQHPQVELIQMVQAAEQGDAEAQYKFAFRSAEDDQAFRFFLKSAEQGHIKAQNKVAELYLSGKGVQKDEKAAFMWYQKAAMAGDQQAKIALGALLIQNSSAIPTVKNNTIEKEDLLSKFDSFTKKLVEEVLKEKKYTLKNELKQIILGKETIVFDLLKFFSKAIISLETKSDITQFIIKVKSLKLIASCNTHPIFTQKIEKILIKQSEFLQLIEKIVDLYFEYNIDIKLIIKNENAIQSLILDWLVNTEDFLAEIKKRSIIKSLKQSEEIKNRCEMLHLNFINISKRFGELSTGDHLENSIKEMGNKLSEINVLQINNEAELKRLIKISDNPRSQGSKIKALSGKNARRKLEGSIKTNEQRLLDSEKLYQAMVSLCEKLKPIRENFINAYNMAVLEMPKAFREQDPSKMLSIMEPVNKLEKECVDLIGLIKEKASGIVLVYNVLEAQNQELGLQKQHEENYKITLEKQKEEHARIAQQEAILASIQADRKRFKDIEEHEKNEREKLEKRARWLAKADELKQKKMEQLKQAREFKNAKQQGVVHQPDRTIAIDKETDTPSFATSHERTLKPRLPTLGRVAQINNQIQKIEVKRDIRNHIQDFHDMIGQFTFFERNRELEGYVLFGKLSQMLEAMQHEKNSEIALLAREARNTLYHGSPKIIPDLNSNHPENAKFIEQLIDMNLKLLSMNWNDKKEISETFLPKYFVELVMFPRPIASMDLAKVKVSALFNIINEDTKLKGEKKIVNPTPKTCANHYKYYAERKTEMEKLSTYENSQVTQCAMGYLEARMSTYANAVKRGHNITYTRLQKEYPDCEQVIERGNQFRHNLKLELPGENNFEDELLVSEALQNSMHDSMQNSLIDVKSSIENIEVDRKSTVEIAQANVDQPENTTAAGGYRMSVLGYNLPLPPTTQSFSSDTKSAANETTKPGESATPKQIL